MRPREIVTTLSSIVALSLMVGPPSAQPVVTCRRSSAEAFAIAYRIAGPDLERFLDILNQQFRAVGLTRELFRECFPAGEAVLQKVELCVQNNEQVCAY